MGVRLQIFISEIFRQIASNRYCMISIPVLTCFSTPGRRTLTAGVSPEIRTALCTCAADSAAMGTASRKKIDSGFRYMRRRREKNYFLLRIFIDIDYIPRIFSVYLSDLQIYAYPLHIYTYILHKSSYICMIMRKQTNT